MASLDIAAYRAALKEHYTPMRVEDMTYQDNPLYALMPKYKKFGGYNLPIPIKFGNPQGRSSDFATAKANKKAGKYERFVLTREHDYSLADIDNETIEASMGDVNAFMAASTTEIDAALMGLNRSLAIKSYRNGSGSIGQIGATTNVATAVLVLANPEDVTNFEVGQVIVASTTDGGGVVKASPKTVIAVDRDLGTVTFNANLNAVVAWALADYVFVEGDYDSAIKGLDAWIPATMPTAGDNFFGVDRSVDTRLAGLRKDVSTMSIEEGLIEMGGRVSREGGKVNMGFYDFTQHTNLQKALGTKVQYVDLRANARIGFTGIMLQVGKGIVNMVPDQNAIPDVAFLLQMNLWKLYSLNEPIRILNLDGNQYLRNSDADSIEVRCGYYAQIGCNGPGYNIRGKLR